MADILISNENTNFSPLQVTLLQQSNDYSESLEKEVSFCCFVYDVKYYSNFWGMSDEDDKNF